MARAGRWPGRWWTERRSPPMPWCSPWVRGPRWPASGSRSRRSAASRGSASPFVRTSRSRPRCCSASTAPRGARFSRPEIYPRPDGEVWVCGMSDDQPVPIDPAHVRVDDARCDELRRIAGTMATGLAEARITRRQAWLPPDLRRRDAAPRTRARPPGCVRRDRAQLLGDPERAGERQGDGGADRDRGGALRRPRALRPREAPRGGVTLGRRTRPAPPSRHPAVVPRPASPVRFPGAGVPSPRVRALRTVPDSRRNAYSCDGTEPRSGGQWRSAGGSRTRWR